MEAKRPTSPCPLEAQGPTDPWKGGPQSACQKAPARREKQKNIPKPRASHFRPFFVEAQDAAWDPSAMALMPGPRQVLAHRLFLQEQSHALEESFPECKHHSCDAVLRRLVLDGLLPASFISAALASSTNRSTSVFSALQAKLCSHPHLPCPYQRVHPEAISRPQGVLPRM